MDGAFRLIMLWATITLPDAIAPNRMSVEAYTGYQGQQGKNYRATIPGPSIAQWNTIEPLAPYEGLTLVITWPKGIVTPPSLLKKIGYFIRDNGALFLLLLGLFTLLSYCLMALRIDLERAKSRHNYSTFLSATKVTAGIHSAFDEPWI